MNILAPVGIIGKQTEVGNWTLLLVKADGRLKILNMLQCSH